MGRTRFRSVVEWIFEDMTEGIFIIILRCFFTHKPNFYCPCWFTWKNCKHNPLHPAWIILVTFENSHRSTSKQDIKAWRNALVINENTNIRCSTQQFNSDKMTSMVTRLWHYSICCRNTDKWVSFPFKYLRYRSRFQGQSILIYTSVTTVVSIAAFCIQHSRRCKVSIGGLYNLS